MKHDDCSGMECSLGDQPYLTEWRRHAKPNFDSSPTDFFLSKSSGNSDMQ